MKTKALNVINFLDGKKTLLGAVLSFVYYGLVGIGVIQQNSTVEWVLFSVLGTGLAHKVVKSRDVAEG